MKQLSGLDSAFLDLEDDHQFLHVSQLLILERPDDPDFAPYPAWRRQLADRLHQLEPLRRRLVEVPFGLDHPYWIADPDFDLDFHVRHSAVPPPGTDDQLDQLVGRLIAAPMDREHPLWVSHVIEGLSDDRFAILTMIHHSAVDGAAGADLLELMLDDVPDAEPPSHAGEWTSEEPPSTAGVLARAAAHGLRRPARGLLLAARAGPERGPGEPQPRGDRPRRQGAREPAGPPGLGAQRRPRARSRAGPPPPAPTRHAARPVQRPGQPLPALRAPRPPAGRGQGRREGGRRDDQRRRGVPVRGRAATVAARPRRAARPAPHRDDPGVAARGRRGRAVDQPGVGHRGGPAHRHRRPARAPAGGARRAARRQAGVRARCRASSRPTRRGWACRPPSPR